MHAYVTLINPPIQENTNMSQTQTIQELNDLFRETMDGRLGRAVITSGIAQGFEPKQQQWIIEKVRQHSVFNEDNDPYEEHDFGTFNMFDTKFYWKIDYYAPDMESGCKNPADPKKSFRVLTIMLAREY